MYITPIQSEERMTQESKEPSVEEFDRQLQLFTQEGGGMQLTAHFEGVGQLSCKLGREMVVSNAVLNKHQASFMAKQADQPPIRFLAQGTSRDGLVKWLAEQSRAAVLPRIGIKIIPSDVVFFAGTTEVLLVRERPPKLAVAHA